MREYLIFQLLTLVLPSGFNLLPSRINHLDQLENQLDQLERINQKENLNPKLFQLYQRLSFKPV